MRFEITVNVVAPLDHVWRCVTDPALVRQCVMGLMSLTEIAPDETYEALVAFPIGQREIVCLAELNWLSREAPQAATLAVRVRLAGDNADANAVSTHSRLWLENGAADMTRLQWQVDVALQGGFAGMPQPLLTPLFTKYSQTFFTCLKASIEASARS